MECRNCHKLISESSVFCEFCGFKIEEMKEKERIKDSNIRFFRKNLQIILPVITIVIIILIIFTVWLINKEGRESHFLNTRGKIIQEGIISSVVNVLCPFSDQDFSLESDGYGGSGTILSVDGIVITNSHIIPQDEEYLDVTEGGCFVMLPETITGQLQEIYLAHPIVIPGISEEYDIAYLEIYDVYVDEEGNKYGEYPKEFPIYNEALCESSTEYVELGEKIRIYGYPSNAGGLSLTVTEGIVSSFSGDGLIYTSAKIDQGNSGGLAVDEVGCMIGIPSAVSVGEYDNLGVIISSDLIREFGDKFKDFESEK